MKLFEIIPHSFFTILSGPKKEIYCDCMFILYSDLKSSTSFGVEREIVVQTLMDYFESLENKGIFDDEDGKECTFMYTYPDDLFAASVYN